MGHQKGESKSALAQGYRFAHRVGSLPLVVDVCYSYEFMYNKQQ